MKDKSKIPTIDEIWEVIFTCSHTITSGKITLKSDGTGKNASNELYNRLKKLLEQ